MKEDFNPQPILEDARVLLRPLRPENFEALYAVASDPAIWEQHPAKERSQREGFTRFFEEALASGSALLILDKSTGEVIGTSRYNRVQESEDALEIGWTFLARRYWGGTYNAAIKALMMNHAFRHYGKLLFYIHHENLRSQRAIQKLGGRRIHEIDGVQLAVRPTASVTYCIERP